MPKQKKTALTRAIARTKRALQTTVQELRDLEQVVAENQEQTPGVAGDQVAPAGGAGGTPRKGLAGDRKAA